MLIYVPLTQLEDNPFQARQEYGDIAELAGRIRAQLPAHPETLGLLQVPTGRLVNSFDGAPRLQPLVAETLERLNELREEAPIARLNDIMDLYEPLVLVYDEIANYLAAEEKGEDEK